MLRAIEFFEIENWLDAPQSTDYAPYIIACVIHEHPFPSTRLHLHPARLVDKPLVYCLAGQIYHFIGFYACLARFPRQRRGVQAKTPRFRHYRPDMSVAVAHRNSQPMPRSSTRNHSPMDSKKSTIKTEG